MRHAHLALLQRKLSPIFGLSSTGCRYSALISLMRLQSFLVGPSVGLDFDSTLYKWNPICFRAMYNQVLPTKLLRSGAVAAALPFVKPCTIELLSVKQEKKLPHSSASNVHSAKIVLKSSCAWSWCSFLQKELSITFVVHLHPSPLVFSFR